MANNLPSLFTFEGRAPRISFALFGPVFAVAGLILTSSAWNLLELDRLARRLPLWLALAVFLAIYTIMTWPLSALAWRRAHDIGLPGAVVALPAVFLLPAAYYAFLHFLPSGGSIGETQKTVLNGVLVAVPISALALLVFSVWPSQPGPNKYGPNPHEVTQ